jgi:predicted outer membrane repeat protein
LGCSAGRGGAWASDSGSGSISNRFARSCLCAHTNSPQLLNSLIKWNSGITGGSIFLSGDASLFLNDVLLLNNTARRGGAVAAERASLLVVNQSTLIFNTASSGGAAIAASDQVRKP